MKYFYHIIVFALLLGGSTTTVQAQSVGGERPGSGTSPARSDFDGYAYLVVGLASPSGGYGSIPNSSSTFNDFEEIYAEGRGAQSGKYIEFGGATYVWEAPTQPVGIGIGWGASGTIFTVDWLGLYDVDDDDVEVETEFFDAVFDLRLGPTVAYQPMPGLIVEASFKLGGGVSTLQNATLSEGSAYLSDRAEEDGLASTAFGIRSSFGLSGSYGPVIGGLEFHRGTATYSDRYIETSGGSFEEEYTPEVAMNATRLYIGLRF